ncbi:MAG: ThuA domain-containing protein [Planctomycetes bacterium]|nr:ThuA domain-containing protein [Planctomycetota bacterium]
MSNSISRILVLCLFASLPSLLFAENPHRLVYQGEKGPGVGKQIVFLAGDHEYRGEETLPALARILAKRYGFKCTVLFTIDPKTGFIKPGSSHISGLEALKRADLMVVFLRFQDFPDEQMQHIVDYLQRGGPVVGLRTSTHAFNIRRKNARFKKYTYNFGSKDFKGGFGRQILGETWAGHYGNNHKQSSRLLLQKESADHPVLRGVKKVWVQSGGYKAFPIEGSRILAKGQILDGMTPDSPAAKNKDQLAVAWVREYRGDAGKTGRVFATTHGASEDILNEGFRRMMVNACLWAAGMDETIKPDNDVALVGPYQPTTFGFNRYRRGVKPKDLAGWTAPILPDKTKKDK